MLVDGRPPTDLLRSSRSSSRWCIAWLLVPFTERFARRIGAIDIPNERSLHAVPTPKLGGLAMLVGALVVAAILFLPLVEQTRAILGGAARDRRRRRRSTTSTSCRRTRSSPARRRRRRSRCSTASTSATSRSRSSAAWTSHGRSDPPRAAVRQRQPRPDPHDARARRDDERHQPDRRGRRARGRRLRDLGGDPGGHRALARPHRAPACSRRSPPARRSASSATASARLELHGRHRLEPARLPARRRRRSRER